MIMNDAVYNRERMHYTNSFNVSMLEDRRYVRVCVPVCMYVCVCMCVCVCA